ncbi:hypothetical protein ACFYKX_04020 [Cytobacillus sp. FJAT-54145]|uniref:Uncharacterized protein n=1 Tax=Cytobacillus spartinae TaxID=3299023 RepID=A0ABW6K866_9BACI
MKKLINLNTLYILAAILVLGVLLIPRAWEIYSFRTQGINYFTDIIENYHNHAHRIEGEYTIEIDLNNLEDNKGKVLFDDGVNQIYVSKVIAHHAKEYELFFSSSGSFSLGGGTIVSGVEYEHNRDGLISNFQAKGNVTYRGDTYQLSHSEFSGLNDLNVDEFSFYLELPDEIVADLDEEGLIDVEVTNLYINFWAKKAF